MNSFLRHLRASSLIIRDHANSSSSPPFYLQRMATPSRGARHAQQALHGSHARFRSSHIAMVPRPSPEARTDEIYRKKLSIMHVRKSSRRARTHAGWTGAKLLTRAPCARTAAWNVAYQRRHLISRAYLEQVASPRSRTYKVRFVRAYAR